MTTLRDAALAALSLVQDTLLERAIDTKRLSAVGRDLEAAIAAEPAQPAQPVAEFHAHPADWQYNITLLPGVPMLLDGTKLYLAPQPPVAPARLTDADFLEARAATYDVVGMGDPSWFLHYGRAVEAEVRRRCGVVG